MKDIGEGITRGIMKKIIFENEKVTPDKCGEQR